VSTTALVLDAGGARSGYQVGVLQVLLPALAEADARPCLLVGTSAGALVSAELASTAHLTVDEQVESLLALLGRMTKPRVMQPLWRQLP
jgi:NTE family protein